MNKLALATLAAINIASAVKIEQSSKSTNEELADNMETLAGGVSTIDDEILEANGNIDDLEFVKIFAWDTALFLSILSKITYFW